MSKRRREKLHRFTSTAQRIIALVLVFSFLIPSRAYALDAALSYGKSLFGSDEKEEEAVPKSNYAEQYQSEADKLKQRLSADTGQGKKKLRLSACKTLAVATSEKIEAVDMKIDAKTAKMQSAVRSLRERERSMGTLRWSPIFNIKLPTKPNEAEAFEFKFKPTQLQNEITLLKHKITEIELDSNEKVSNTYIKIITANDEVERLTARRKKLQSTVNKLEVKVKLGTAALEEGGVTETDAEGNEVEVSPRVLKARVRAAQDKLENAQKRLENCETELINAKSDFETSKKKLSTLINFDCTTNFFFEDAFITANMDRDILEYLYSYALDDDSSVYEAQLANDEALLTLQINFDLMKKTYPDNISKIETYVQQSLDGVKIPKKAFKRDYDEFLKAIDLPWQGSYKIWFIKIPKEWLKGEIDGIRYVQDDPYVLYSAALDYEAARKDLENAKSELYNSIYESYNNYASSRKTYLAANKAYVKAEKLLGIDEIRYLLGELTADEFETEESEFNSLKDDAASALSEFSETLYSFDRTTCGGVSKFFEGAAQTDTEAISLTPVIRRGCIYIIRPIIDTQEFLLTIDVPDDFEAETGIKIDQFELYCDGNKIGERTQVGENLRHLMLSTKDLGECTIRVYNGETFIDECVIEPSVFQGPLNITVGYEENLNAHVLGKFVVSDDTATDMMVLTLNMDQEQVRNEYENGNDAAFYKLCLNDGKYILSDRLVPIDNTFTYLNFLKNDLDSTYIELYDAQNDLIGKAFFDTKTKEIYNDISEEDAAKLAEQKRIEAEKRAEEEAEAARLAEEQEKRDAAAEVLKALGMAVDAKSIAYAMQHLNELNYSLELLMSSASLRAEHDKDVAKYEEMLKDPTTKPEDLKAMADRIRITEKMPGIYDKTLGDGIKYNVEELDKYTEQYIKQLAAEYVGEYNVIKDDTATAARKESANKRMSDIKKEVEEKYKSDAIKVAEEALIPFDETISKLYEFKSETIFTTAKLDEYKALCTVVESSVKTLKKAGYGDSFKGRYHRALFFTLKITGDAGKKIKMSDITAESLTDAYYNKTKAVYDYSVYIGKILEKSDAVDEKDRDEYTDSCDDAWAKVQEVEEERQSKIKEINEAIKKNYANLQPETVLKNLKVDMKGKNYATYIIDTYNTIQADIDKLAKYHGTPEYTKAQVDKTYNTLASGIIDSMNTTLFNLVSDNFADPTDLRNALNKAETNLNSAKAKYKNDGSTANEEAYNAAKIEYDKQNNLWNDYCTKLDQYYKQANTLIESIEKAKGTPRFDKATVKKKYEENKNRNVLDSSGATVTNTETNTTVKVEQDTPSDVVD
ncbi:MAG: TolC family protein [Lachnospiraceae bacterium]|nr:TolC family protein [Lachnospiraceae bacterium]